MSHFPKAYAFVLGKHQLASFYKKLQRLQEAKTQYLLAKEFFSALFPHNEDYADCLRGLSEVYETMNKLGDAEEQLLQALQLSSEHSLKVRLMQGVLTVWASYTTV